MDGLIKQIYITFLNNLYAPAIIKALWAINEIERQLDEIDTMGE